MARLVYVAQEFSIARYGAIDITWTDDSGIHSITAITSGTYRHATSAADTLTTGDDTSLTNTAATKLAATLQTAMDAATAQTVTVTYSDDTNRYTITCSGSVFTITWGAGDETRMRKLLGFSGNVASSPAVGDIAPYFTIEPRKNVRQVWADVQAMRDVVSSHITGDGDLRTVGPTRIPYLSRCEFGWETDAQTLIEHETRFSWQRFWNDAGRYGMLCYLVDYGPPVGSTSRWAFKLRTPSFDDSTHRRERPELRDRWHISIDALLRGRF